MRLGHLIFINDQAGFFTELANRCCAVIFSGIESAAGQLPAGSEAGVCGIAGVEEEHVAGRVEGDDSYDRTLQLGKIVG